PCAIQTDYAKDGWRVDRNGVVEVIPPTPDLEKLIGGLGIGNASHVVLVAPGSSAADMGGATRVFWTFTVLGHDKVSILNGGFAAYVKDKTNPLDTQVHKLPPVTFQAKVRNEMLIGKAEVIAAAKNGVKLVDSRPSDQYMGVNKSGQVKRYGTIPGAINLPGLWLTVDGGGMFRPKNELDTLFKESDAPVSGKNITFCNTGHWASLGWFVSYVLMSNKDTLMYDGSMTEYAADEALPIDRKVKL
ncbi:MAG: rhodanese-like domain-containing protein, partial [Deltaproteobacteria bacterium]|nr:rhodanese-like domain-containing protein [Deltaproteobacteria bacterium]